MKLSLNWLKNYVSLTASADEITRALTFLGFEVEGVHRTGLAPIANLVVGEILTRDKHPNADKLSVCSVRVAPDGAPTQIVCGAPNCDAGRRVPVALPGCVLGGDFKIKQSKIRGVESNGMMCSARELGLGDDHQGLLILSPDAPLGQPVHEALGAGDVVFDVEVTPNRPDALSHVGMARELAAWFKLPLAYPAAAFTAVPPEAAAVGASLLAGVQVAADEACPLYTAHIIQGVKIAPSPDWLQKALTAVGLRPINNVVDVTNYVLLETGQPLHAFDAKKIRGPRLLVRHAADGEKLITLDGKERTLSSQNLVIADAERALVVAGVMGGADAEVDNTTVDLVLESAYFKPTGIRRTSKQIQLSSDSSYRFERGVDPRGVLPAARRAIDLILQTAGGRVLGPAYVVGAEPTTVTEITLAPDYVRERCGFEISDPDQRDTLERLELDVSHETTDGEGRTVWTVSVPSWRGDLERPIDLVEEILRVYGTEKIPTQRPVVRAVVSGDDPVALFARKAATVLVGQGFTEAVNYTLRSAAELDRWATKAAAEELRLANPLAEDQSHLRRSLIPGLLDTIRFNQARQNTETRFFETGRTFREVNGAVYELVSAAFVVALPEAVRGWKPRELPDFHAAKRLVLDLASSAGVVLRDEQFRAVNAGSTAWQDGHSAEAGSFQEGCEVRVGLVNLALTRAAGIDGPVLAGLIEILPDKLRQSSGPVRYKPVSTFPAATRDLALIADDSVPAAQVLTALTKSARKALNNAFALERVELFDLYRGTGLPDGKKSLAFGLVFRAADRTLTDDEVNKVFAAVQQDIEAAGYPVRR
ncbi:MAG: phenylalanine--tRNA ligase subunit beta [Opitutaceae bacterium]|nr:phenylalanine--tRNA ligase subunit beta [Opitutaceae bacterium]